jgi:hypothetical protein
MLCEREGCGRTVPARPARRAAFAGLCKHCRRNTYTRVLLGLNQTVEAACAWLRITPKQGSSEYQHRARLPDAQCRRAGCSHRTPLPGRGGRLRIPELVGFCKQCRGHAFARTQRGESYEVAAQWLDAHPRRPNKRTRARQITPASARET